MRVLITGCAGFIGFHLSNKLSTNNNFKIFGIDNINSYYDTNLKKKRLTILKKLKNFKFFKIDITDTNKLKNNFKNNNYDIVINLAAQAGVRDSEKKPDDYKNNNIDGFYNIINFSQKFKIKHLLFASTSSVYGSQKKFPTKEANSTDMPLSFYAASKKTNESIAYSFSNIYKLNCTAMRFFTVYGPYGRPDMALFLFVDAIIKNKAISLFNKGNHVRDFTYVDDLVNYIIKLIPKKPNKAIPFDVYNIGSGKPQSLKNFLKIICKKLNKKANIIYLPLQKGDVYKTHADVTKIKKITKSSFYTDLENGIENFIKWYKGYYRYD